MEELGEGAVQGQLRSGQCRSCCNSGLSAQNGSFPLLGDDIRYSIQISERVPRCIFVPVVLETLRKSFCRLLVPDLALSARQHMIRALPTS